MASMKESIQQFGLTEVYCSPNPLVDVVLVHGLNGHPYNTWATHKPEVYWPVDLLPELVEDQHCRILTYGYDANVATFTDGASKDHIHNHAEHLAARLVANRSVKARERPLIFIAHSLGGLVVKRLLIYCESINNPKLERLRSIYVSTFGILFLGTPHNGSDLAKWGSLLQSICSVSLPKRWLDTSPQLVNALKTNNETLQNINRLFVQIMEPFRIYFFHEMKPMDLKTTRQFVVDEDSAAPDLQGVERMGIEKDHSNMCKFEDIRAPGFDVVADAIATYAEEAPSTVKGRWEREKRVREYYRQSIASELLGDNVVPLQQARSLSPGSNRESEIRSAETSVQSLKILDQASSQTPPKQLRVAPLLFRPNSIFVGFEIELDQLKHKLSSEKKKKIGTCSVLICGPPGSGKSHLARQFVWTQQADYPAGVFWVDCKSRQSRDRYYWDIGQALGCLDNDSPSTFQDDRIFVQEVRKCLESLQGWLIVFDGLFFDSDEALSEFVPYIPDSSGNGIIFTSVDPTLKNRHRLLNPSWVRMRPLNSRAACDLLFKSLNMRNYTPLQLRKAQELVRNYGYLPLGIHAAAHMLVAQGRALEKFSPANTDRRLVNPFLEIVQALESGGYVEATTLLVLLCFMNHNVPVVLLQFGSSSLTEVGREVTSTDRAGGVRKNLDNTIGVLLRYGLVDRELQTCSVSSPRQLVRSPHISRTTTAASVSFQNRAVPILSEESSDLKLIMSDDGDDDSGGSQTSVSISIDTLRTHTVTQAVVREEIKARGIQGLTYERWLLLACKFLCSSYSTAAEKLSKLPGPGSVADYREYKSQVTTLWKLLPRSNRAASASLAGARNDLKAIFREIQDEIRTRSPSQSQSSKAGPFKYIGSIFETSASSSEEDGPPTPSDITRSSTWSSEKHQVQSESPTHYQRAYQGFSEDVLSDLDEDDNDEDDAGYATELDDLTSTMQSSERSGLASDSGVKQVRPVEGSPRQGILQAILQGHSTDTRRKDLGEFKPLPTIGPVSTTKVQTVKPRSFSSSSFNLPWPFGKSASGSSAEEALTAVQAKSPHGSTYPTHSRKTSTSSENPEGLRTRTERHLLSSRPTSTQIANVMPDFDLSPTENSIGPQTYAHRHSRNASTSPRLVNAVLSREAAKTREETLADSSADPMWYISQPNMAQAAISNRGNPSMPRPPGYMSVPMSRDVSRESNKSVLSAPSEAVLTPVTPYQDSSSHQSRTLPSIDITMSRSYDLSHRGGWIDPYLFGNEDDTHEFDFNRTPATAPTSMPTSPRLSQIVFTQRDSVGSISEDME